MRSETWWRFRAALALFELMGSTGCCCSRKCWITGAMARWKSWNRELEKAEAEEQAELEKQRAIMEFDPAHLY